MRYVHVLVTIILVVLYAVLLFTEYDLNTNDRGVGNPNDPQSGIGMMVFLALQSVCFFAGIIILVLYLLFAFLKNEVTRLVKVNIWLSLGSVLLAIVCLTIIQ